MNYIKSAGFFSIFYVILYFGLSIGLRFFITDSDLFTGLFYVILLAATLIYLKICGDDIKTTLRIHPIHIGSFFLIILLAFTIRPVAGFITLIANLFFKDMTTTTMTQRNFAKCFVLWNCPYELSTILLCFFSWNRLWLPDRSL